MDNKDFNDRVSKLLSDKNNNTVKETDDELAQRFNNVFSTEPIAKQQKLSYHIPDNAYNDVDEQIEKMLQESDDDDDEINDLIYGELTQEDKTLDIEAEEKISSATKLFLGSEFDVGTDESDDLIRRIQEENALDSKYQAFAKTRNEEFESRVSALKKDAPNTTTMSTTTTTTTTATTTSSMHDKPAGSIPKPLQAEDLHDEMDDWCCVCNEDATVECLGCDNDKFCSNCFFQTHKSEMADYEATKHKSKAYNKRF